MTSILDQLNELLRRERGEVEAVQELIAEIAASDPDIAETARDALETASWSCHGLYHRIVHLKEVPTLESADLVETLSEQPNTKSKIEVICREQQEDLHMISRLLRQKELDKDTRDFLKDLLKAHEVTKTWCEATLAQWKVDR